MEHSNASVVLSIVATQRSRAVLGSHIARDEAGRRLSG
jgi:hypothetical protein